GRHEDPGRARCAENAAPESPPLSGDLGSPARRNARPGTSSAASPGSGAPACGTDPCSGSGSRPGTAGSGGSPCGPPVDDADGNGSLVDAGDLGRVRAREAARRPRGEPLPAAPVRQLG